MQYFKECTTIDEAKNLFRKLSKELHPDTSGKDTGVEFIKMYKEFESFKPSDNKSGETFNAQKFYNTIKKFEGLENIKVSFVGSFIWLEDEVKGATYKQKEALKSINIEGYNTARFHGKKKCWYFSPADYKQKSRSRKSLEEIKNTFGCESFKTKQRLQLA